MKKKQKKEVSEVSAVALLGMESQRLYLMAKASKSKGKQHIEAMAWAFQLSSSFLAALNAPEKIHRFKELSPAALKMDRAKQDELVEARITNHRSHLEKHGLD
jgi:hypothetical protein